MQGRMSGLIFSDLTVFL